jgi:hypothetical protein
VNNMETWQVRVDGGFLYSHDLVLMRTVIFNIISSSLYLFGGRRDRFENLRSVRLERFSESNIQKVDKRHKTTTFADTMTYFFG